MRPERRRNPNRPARVNRPDKVRRPDKIRRPARAGEGFPKPKYYVGLDLGQAQDHTAIVVVERRIPPNVRDDNNVIAGYAVRHLDRVPLDTPYPVIVKSVITLMQRSPLAGDAKLIIDATGVGAPIFDLFEQAGLRPIGVITTAGDRVSGGPRWKRCPKRDLMTNIQVLLQSGRLHIARELSHSETLARELKAFRVKLTASGRDRWEAQDGEHDDMVFALSLAAWWPERYNVRRNAQVVYATRLAMEERTSVEEDLARFTSGD